jgi:hypothetical protein
MEIPNSPPPCRYCGHEEFVVSPNVHLTWAVMDGDSWNTAESTIPRTGPWAAGEEQWTSSFKGGVLVCTRCGHLELFMANVGEWTQSLASYPWRMTRTPT